MKMEMLKNSDILRIREKTLRGLQLTTEAVAWGFPQNNFHIVFCLKV
jgi:hypothetical protein